MYENMQMKPEQLSKHRTGQDINPCCHYMVNNCSLVSMCTGLYFEYRKMGVLFNDELWGFLCVYVCV